MRTPAQPRRCWPRRSAQPDIPAGKHERPGVESRPVPIEAFRDRSSECAVESARNGALHPLDDGATRATKPPVSRSKVVTATACTQHSTPPGANMIPERTVDRGGRAMLTKWDDELARLPSMSRSCSRLIKTAIRSSARPIRCKRSHVEVLLILGVIVAIGLLAMSEHAIGSASKSRLRQWSSRGDRGAEAALGLSEDPKRLLWTVQAGTTLLGTLAGVYGGATLVPRLSRAIEGIGPLAPYHRGIGLGVRRPGYHVGVAGPG